MRYTINYSTKNGLGKPAISVFLRGCDKPSKCSGCHNDEYQQIENHDYNLEHLLDSLSRQISTFSLIHKEINVAILGGEPLSPYNREITKEISKYIKKCYPHSVITVYTYRDRQAIEKQSLIKYLKYVDFGVLGEFNEALLDLNYLPSSTNQVIYDFNSSVELSPIYLK